MFIAVDGPNGVGKTTLCNELFKRLEQRGRQILSLRQPSDTALGDFIRNEHFRIKGMSLAALVVADRLWQLETQINPALADGSIVLLDRYVASTLVLQRIDGVDIDILWKMNEQVRIPDATIILLASPGVLSERLDRRGRTSRFDRHEQISQLEDTYFREAVDHLAKAGYKLISVDTDDLSIEEVGDKAVMEISHLL
jgi:dTMP kinase